jgi:hypothetical protein
MGSCSEAEFTENHLYGSETLEADGNLGHISVNVNGLYSSNHLAPPSGNSLSKT